MKLIRFEELLERLGLCVRTEMEVMNCICSHYSNKVVFRSSIPVIFEYFFIICNFTFT